MTNPDEQLSEHFKRSELACHCCGQLILNERLLPALEALRALAGAPIEVLDAYRCPTHNAGALGVPKSAHLDGRAADIRIYRASRVSEFPPDRSPWLSLQEMYDLANQIADFRDGGIGIYDAGTMHVDVRGTHPARWARVNGVYTSIAGSGLLQRYP